MNKNNKPSQDTRPSSPRKPLITALEPRILLDGAIGATATELTTDLDAVQLAPPVGDLNDNRLPLSALVTAPNQTVREVAFIDSGLDSYQTLATALSDTVDVFIINGTDNALAVMAEALKGREGLEAIHIYSHGNSGALVLGGRNIDADTLKNYSSELAGIGSTLKDDGDILLYGCRTGAGEKGGDFLRRFAALTGADIAASNDITGSAKLGGDWELEVARGDIETEVLADTGYSSTLAPVQVSVFSQPNLNGTDSSPNSDNENANLASIVQNIINKGGNYSLDTSIQSFTDVNLEAKLKRSGFFFMTDMERADPTSPSFLPDSAKAIIRNWVSDGGVILMTGTSGPKDVQFLNAIFGWDLITKSSASWNLNTTNAAGTPFEGGPVSLASPSATDSIGKGTVANFTTIYGTDSNTTLATIGYGSGTVIFLGFDFYSTGIAGTGFRTSAPQYGADVSNGGQRTNVWVTEIIPRALEYSASLAGAGDISEDTTYTFAPDAFQASGGTTFPSIKITSLPDAGKGVLRLDNVALSVNQTINSSQYADLTFTPAANFNGDATFTWQGYDGTYGADTDFTITVGAVNDAPSFSGAVSLPQVAEDATNPPGNTVTNLFGSRFSDVDGDSLTGIAIVADNSTSAQGAWEYSTDSGGTWHEVGSVSSDRGLLLAGSTKLRFLPAANFNGTPGGLTAHGVDNSQTVIFTTGGTRRVFNATADDASSPVSSGMVSLASSVQAVNDAPWFTGNGTLSAVNEDTTNPSGATVASLMAGQYTDRENNSFAGVVVTGNNSDSAQGIWQYSSDGGSVWHNIGSVSQGSGLMLAANARIRFIPVANFNGATTPLDVHAVDSTYYGAFTNNIDRVTYNTTSDDTTSPVSTGYRTLGTSITPINDAPSVANDTGTVAESGGYDNRTGGGNATGNVLDNDTDIDSGDTKEVYLFKKYGGSTYSVTPGSSRTISGNYGTLTLHSNGNYTYEVNESHAVVQALRTSGNTMEDGFIYWMRDSGNVNRSASLKITITGSNDAPVAVTDSGVAVEAGGSSNSWGGNNATGNVLTNDTDVESSAGDQLAVVGITFGGSTLAVASGRETQIDGQYGTLVINADGSFRYQINETSAAVQVLRGAGLTLTEQFTYTVQDNADPEGNLTHALNDKGLITITIDGRNDAPVAVADSGLATESGGTDNRDSGSDATGNVLSNDTDAESHTGDALRVVAITAGSQTRLIDETGFTVIQGRYGRLQISADGSYRYIVNNGHPTVQGLHTAGQTLIDTFHYQVQDNADDDGIFSRALHDSGQLSITINGRNDAPVALGINGDHKWSFGRAYTRNVSTLFIDADSAANGESLTYNIGGLPRGLLYDRDTGQITGRPKIPGIFEVRITATDSAGLSASRSYQMTVIAPPPPSSGPSIPSVNAVAGFTDSAGTGRSDGSGSGTEGGLTGVSSRQLAGESSLSGGGPDGIAAGKWEAGRRLDSSGHPEPGPAMPVVENEAEQSELELNITAMAAVDVSVGQNGGVRFSGQEQAAEQVALQIADIVTSGNGIDIRILDMDDQPHHYTASLASGGTELPAWLSVNARTGEIHATPPSGLSHIDILLRAIGPDGSTRILEIRVDLEELYRNNRATGQEHSAVFTPLAEQLNRQAQSGEQHGQQLLDALAASQK